MSGGTPRGDLRILFAFMVISGVAVIAMVVGMWWTLT